MGRIIPFRRRIPISNSYRRNPFLPCPAPGVSSTPMSYQVLARKYRPRTFAEVVGQDHVMRTLRNAIQNGRIAHAFLFVGPRGIGKTSTARILAKALNAAGGPNADFDPDHPLAVEIAEGRSMDVIEIDGASNNGVEQIRELRENAQYRPAHGNFKIYIIDEVHMLSTGAFNALLKTLEEPPAHVKFIFATTEVHKVLPTILSRCQRFDLKRISEADIAKQLGFIAKEEGIDISERALRILARNAEGGMRDAESAFDQLISFCGKKITEDDVLEVFGLTGPSEIWNLAEALQNGLSDSALRQLRDLTGRGKDLSRLTQDLLRYFRNLMVFSVSPDIARDDLEESELHHFGALHPLPTRELCLAFIDELVRLDERIRFALVKDVLFEITMLRLCQQHRKVRIEDILRQLTGGAPSAAPDLVVPAIESAPAQKPRATIPRPEPAPASAPQHSSEPAAVEPPASAAPAPVCEDDATLWGRAIEPLKKTDMLLRRVLGESTFLGIQQGIIRIETTVSADLYQSFRESRGYDQLLTALQKSFGPGIQLHIDAREPEPEPARADEYADTSSRAKQGPAKTPAKSSGPPLDKSDFTNDPLIKAALEAFDARIVTLRDA